MDHSVPTVGSRWEADNRTLFYTGDTGPKGDWRAAAQDVDLMLSEAAYQERGDGDYPHHLTSAEAGQIAREVGARRLVLTHIPPYLDVSRSVEEAETTFDRPVSLAMPGVTFDV
jgi:ribonuclease BN (tRNA processing enzyme)